MPFGIEKIILVHVATWRWKKNWRYVYSFWHDPRTWQTNRHTDRHTDTAWRLRPRLHSIARQKFCVALRPENCGISVIMVGYVPKQQQPLHTQKHFFVFLRNSLKNYWLNWNFSQYAWDSADLYASKYIDLFIKYSLLTTMKSGLQ